MAGPAGPGLRSFLLRSHVLALYRGFLRTARAAPPQSRGALVAHIREEFRSQRVADEQQLKHLLRQGQDRLRQLDDTLGLATATK